ncbi:MAG: phosphoribosyltransferase family protein [Bacteroidota bacterium]
MYEVTTFKDGQVASKITEPGDLHVKIRGNTYADLFKAASIKEAWDHADLENKNRIAILEITCLIGQRSDRRFNEKESFDLKVIADFINNMNYDQVKILHPHSSVVLALINNAVQKDHLPFVKKAYEELNKPVLVSPDAGAYKDTHRIAEALNAKLVPANKVRVEGKPIISIQGEVQGLECLIVDDIADGGRTFIELAKALRQQGASKVFLYVTHSLFNYGLKEINQHIDAVYCTNSYREIKESNVAVMNLNFG